MEEIEVSKKGIVKKRVEEIEDEDDRVKKMSSEKMDYHQSMENYA
ncbi:UDP-N-acetylmuramoylalanyl-D-glutamate--2,6-diaminopimelate ligase, partial [Pasteurella multocida]|nr:UDP-N-acetylmuramoylalanyl-D-glutamate--2,6-diaminopimelate ligase [Pasteurella multocida]NMR62287.1 UDP-N-acetylmuramoylalanyl-D-glutamate--2,6-diaminopimelate ligase [Pasteurella multocida]